MHRRCTITRLHWGPVHCIKIAVFFQLSPHVLIQSMRTSFCIYRLINRQNTGYSHQIWAIGARSGLLGVILSDGGFYSSALYSLLMTAFRGRNQRFIMECTLLCQRKARLRPFVLWLHLMGEMASRSDDWNPIDRCTHAVFAA